MPHDRLGTDQEHPLCRDEVYRCAGPRGLPKREAPVPAWRSGPQETAVRASIATAGQDGKARFLARCIVSTKERRPNWGVYAQLPSRGPHLGSRKYSAGRAVNQAGRHFLRDESWSVAGRVRRRRRAHRRPILAPRPCPDTSRLVRGPGPRRLRRRRGQDRGAGRRDAGGVQHGAQLALAGDHAELHIAVGLPFGGHPRGQARRAQQRHEPAQPPEQLPDPLLRGLVKPVVRVRAVNQHRAHGTVRIPAGPVRATTAP